MKIALSAMSVSLQMSGGTEKHILEPDVTHRPQRVEGDVWSFRDYQRLRGCVTYRSIRDMILLVVRVTRCSSAHVISIRIFKYYQQRLALLEGETD